MLIIRKIKVKREISLSVEIEDFYARQNIPLSTVSEEGLKCKHREGRRILNQSFIKSEREEEGRKFDSGKRYEFAAVLAGIGGGRDVGIRGIYTVGSRYIRGLGFDLHLGP